MERERKFKVILAPKLELAKEIKADYTVEAEYGDYCIEGNKLTLAHHGSRSGNPAPCNTQIDEKFDGGTILISHIDLDTIGGIMAIEGIKPEYPEFWKAAEYIDINGPHHINEIDSEISKKIDIYEYLSIQNRKKILPERDNVSDVTEIINGYIKNVYLSIDEKNPEYPKMQEETEKYFIDKKNEIERKLTIENKLYRVFETDGLFCNAAYYSEKNKNVVPVIIAYNSKFKSITLSFEDGGKEHDACAIMQHLFGKDAGGHPGIAGTPRGKEYEPADMYPIMAEIDRIMSPKINKEKEFYAYER